MLIRVPAYTCIVRKSAYSSSFVTPAFWNRLVYRNADGRINSGNDSATSCGNLVSFGLVSLECAKLNCIQQVTISTRKFTYIR